MLLGSVLLFLPLEMSLLFEVVLIRWLSELSLVTLRLLWRSGTGMWDIWPLLVGSLYFLLQQKELLWVRV